MWCLHEAIVGATGPRNKSHVCFTRQLKGSPYSIAERRVPELIPVLSSQPAGDVSHKPGGRLPLLSAGLQLPPQPLRGQYRFCGLVNRGTVGVNSLPKTVT